MSLLHKPKPLSWKPVRRGDTYCAPACGGGCTIHAFNQAKTNAQSLVDGLGRGWKPHVWENLGWHFSAISPDGRIKVHPFGGGMKGYTAFIGLDASAGGKWTGQHRLPKTAIKKAMATVRAESAVLNEVIAMCDKIGF